MADLTNGEVEKRERALCEKDGGNPNLRIREYGQSSWDHWLWEEYCDEVRASQNPSAK